MRFFALTAAFLWMPTAFALDGQIQIHDPSTIVQCDGKYYTYGTGGSSLISDDGWTWRRGTAPARRGMAPDAIKLGDRYYLYVARNVGAQPRAEINMIWSKSLTDPTPPTTNGRKAALSLRQTGLKTAMPLTRAFSSIPTMADSGWFTDPISVTSAWSNSTPKPGSVSIPKPSPSISRSIARPPS
jgi:hypothetical protein